MRTEANTHRPSTGTFFSRRIPQGAALTVTLVLSSGCGSNSASGNDGSGGGTNFGTGGVSVGNTGGSAGGGAPSSGGITSGSGGNPFVGSGGTAANGGTPGSGGTLSSNGGTAGGEGGSPTGGSSNIDGGGGASGSTSDAGTAPCVKGKVKGSEVVIIGDSYVQIPGTLEGDIETLARMEGALGSTETYRNYAVSGTSLGNGQIPSQYTSAKAANPDIKVVIMDGGGNDVLLLNSQCLSANPTSSNASCVMTVANAISAAQTLAAQMAADGVEDLVYFFYPEVPAVTGDVLSYSEPKAQAFCDALTKPRCHFVSTREAFAGKTAQYIGLDGIHPTTAGAQVIAGLIWDTMQKYCIAQ